MVDVLPLKFFMAVIDFVYLKLNIHCTKIQSFCTFQFASVKITVDSIYMYYSAMLLILLLRICS